MEAKNKRIKNSKPAENTLVKKSKIDLDDIDLGDADGSSGNLGMDNFKSKTAQPKLPSEKGRIEEL